MSVRINSVSEGLERVTNLPSVQGPFTIMAWFYRSVNQPGNTEECLFRYGEALGNQIFEAQVRNNSLAFWDGSVTTQPGRAWPVNTWNHVCLRRNTLSTVSMVLNGTEYLVVNPPNFLTERLLLGNNGEFGEFWDGRIAAFKAWDAYLNIAQISEEIPFWGPVVTTGINAWNPLMTATELQDNSGNGNHFTSFGGTLTTEDNPPVRDIMNPIMMHVDSKEV